MYPRKVLNNSNLIYIITLLKKKKKSIRSDSKITMYVCEDEEYTKR